MIVSQNENVPDRGGRLIDRLFVDALPLTVPLPVVDAETDTVSTPPTFDEDAEIELDELELDELELDTLELDEIVLAYAAVGKIVTAASNDRAALFSVFILRFLIQPPTIEAFGSIGRG